MTCYRLYDRDIPEVPLVIDWYEGRLHIAEMANRDEAAQEDWLDTLVDAAADALDVPRDMVFVKRRRRQQGAAQYERLRELKRRIEVSEGGLKFLVNLTDYLDTGLFLDHRSLRAQVREEVTGKRLLNLYAYTGSFTVYAAAGEAASTMTVDLSNTYLEWARANLVLNGLDGPQHKFYRKDVIVALKEMAKDGATFDLAIVDPPTFSNSKGVEDTFDVQRDHEKLIHRVIKVLSPGGVLYFSTNAKRFRLGDIEGVEVAEITHTTVPDDFAQKRPHRCWRMVKSS